MSEAKQVELNGLCKFTLEELESMREMMTSHPGWPLFCKYAASGAIDAGIQALEVDEFWKVKQWSGFADGLNHLSQDLLGQLEETISDFGG